MRIPSISFIENNVGSIPVRQNIRNRVGIISTFSRGSTSPTFITGDSFFANNYGFDTNIGSLAYQAARDQGAEDFLCVRVLGNPKPAKGQVTFTGVAEKDNTLYFNISFIGLVQKTTEIAETVVSSGEYSGSVSGRYFFKVSQVSGTNATLKYSFVALGGNEVIDWDTVTDNITVRLVLDKGLPLVVEDGVSLTFGQVGQTNSLALVAGNEFKLRVTALTYPIYINEGDIPYQIATTIQSQLSGVDIFGELSLTSNNTGVIFELDTTNTALLGSIGNRFSYSFSLEDGFDAGIATTPALQDVTSFTGGEDGPRQAYRDFFSISGTPLLRLQANYVGDYGNNIKVTLYPDNRNSFRLVVEDLNAGNFNPRLQSETYTVNFNDLDENGLLNQLKSSIYINGIFLPKFADPVGYNINLVNQSPLRLAPVDSSVGDVEDPRNVNYFGPSKLIDISLENGYDGPLATDDDYIKAINSLNGLPVHIVITPGIYDSPLIQQALVNHCERATDKDALRIAILNSKPRLSPNAAKVESFGFNSNRAVKVVGWSTYAGQPKAPRFGLSPDAIYAGLLAAIPFYVSPHARRSAGSARNITEVDTANNSSQSALQLYTDAKLEVLHVDSASQAFFFTTGRTLSSDPAWETVYVRRSYDFIRQDLYEMLIYYIGEPHTLRVRVQIQGAIEQYLRRLSSLGYIANYKNVLVSSENNSADLYSQGILNISFDFLPLEAINYINVTINRSSADGLAITSN